MSKYQKLNSFNCKKTFSVKGKDFTYVSLKEAEKNGLGDLSKLPKTLKVLLENLLRWEDGKTVTKEDITAVAAWLKNKSSSHEIAYRPARVLMQDFTGVPAVVDLAAMRDAVKNLGGSPDKINPISAVDLVIDHSVSVESFANEDSFRKNVEIEFKRNKERYEFLKWGQNAFENFRVVPPGTGICHQVNLEYLAKVVWHDSCEQENWVFPDTLVGTDSHTTMINGLSVLGWGVGGIEAEAAMLGQAISMLIPEVVGFKVHGKLKEGITATDLVLTVTEQLRAHGVVGKFVEFYGSGLKSLSLADRATIANMSPEYGATCGYFPIDEETLKYMNLSGRDLDQIKLVEEYAKLQGFWEDASVESSYTSTLELDLGSIEPCIAGPKRPQDRIALKSASSKYTEILGNMVEDQSTVEKRYPVKNQDYDLGHGDVVIAAITSCTNTSNPSVMIAAGLVAKKANEKGLKIKPWVKPSLAPGSQVVTEYLEKANLQSELNTLGFNLVGYGCTTCIGNSGPLPEDIKNSINDNQLTVASVLSGNRNFEGRISPHIKTNFLASPPLVVAYALAGSLNVDLNNDSLGKDQEGNNVFFKDLWPTNAEINQAVSQSVNREMFVEKYADVFKGTDEWQAIATSDGTTYDWVDSSTYVKNPPFFTGMSTDVEGVKNVESANILALLGDSVTTDHISPAGAIQPSSVAGEYLKSKGIGVFDFNSFGSRRGNHEVMMRGTFGNVRLRNEMLDGVEGGFTKYIPSGEQMSIFEASEKYIAAGKNLVVIAGKEYGTGSSRDWAAKGTILLGIKAVVAESYERIHRSNLVGMGVLPLEFTNSVTRKSLNLVGDELITITGLENGLSPRMNMNMKVQYKDGTSKECQLLCRVDTQDEVDYVNNGGILHFVIRKLVG